MTSIHIQSPAPGIFWHRPNPEAEPFLKAGDSVSVGQVVGIIEVMKMFVDIHSDREGLFKAYVADDGETVPMGAALVELEESE